MQATEIELPGIGEPETLRNRTRELAEPGPGQALVRVEASGVSFAEQQMRRGKYYDQPKFPFVPGYDLVGIVESIGRRVAALTKVGGWADRVVLDTADLVPVPDGVSAEAAETVVVTELREDLGRVLGLVAEGALTPQIAARFPLARAAEALRFAEAGGNTGKVVIVP